MHRPLAVTAGSRTSRDPKLPLAHAHLPMRIPSLVAFVLVVASAHAQAPCGAWTPQFAAPGPDRPFESYATHDDGSGPALYAGGSLSDSPPGRFLSKWDGVTWSELGSGPDDVVRAL